MTLSERLALEAAEKMAAELFCDSDHDDVVLLSPFVVAAI